jgi:hypothetical protein
MSYGRVSANIVIVFATYPMGTLKANLDAGVGLSLRLYCGVFTPSKNCNIETRSRDYATVDEAVFSPCRAAPHDSCKRLDGATVGRDHVTASAVTSHFSTMTQQ